MSNNKKAFLITIIIIDFLLIVSGLVFLSQFENFSYKNYNNYKYGFKINYPSYFTVNDNEDTFAQEVVSFIDNQYNIKVTIKVESLGDKTMTVQEYVKDIENLLKDSLSPSKILEKSLTENLTGLPRAYRLVYENKTSQVIEFGGLNGNSLTGFQAYIIIAEADKRDKGKLKIVMNKMTKSFELIQ